MAWELVIDSMHLQIVSIIGGYSIWYEKHENVPVITWQIAHYINTFLISRLTFYFKFHTYEKETIMFKILLPHVNLHQLVEKAGLEQMYRVFFNEPICNLFGIDVFTVMHFQ